MRVVSFREHTYFIQGENSEIDVCFLDSETGKELIAYGQIDITIGKLKSSVKKRTVSGALWINDNNGKKLWFIKAGKSYSFIYDELEIDEIDYISDITDNERWAFVKLNTNEENKYFCFDLKNGKFSELIVKSGNLQYIDKILDTENNLYLYNEDGKILSVDKMTFVVSTIMPYEGLGKEIQISDTETKEETIESLVWINNQLYIGYMEEHGICNSEGNSRTYLYGIKDLLGEIKLGGFENVEIIICGDYIIIDSKIYASKIYDSTFKLLTDKGIYKKVFEGKEDGLAWVYSYDESSDMKVVLYNQNTGEKIYESAKEEPSYDNKKIDKYCKLEVYDKDTYEKRVLLINSENDEMVYQGKAFVHEDKKNQKVVVFEKKNSSKPIETPTIAPTVNPTEIPENTVAPTVSPTKKPVTGQIIPSYQYPPTITFTPEPTVTIAPTVSPSDTPVVTFEPTVNPTEIPENTVAPTVKPENTLVPTVTPGIAPDTDNNNTSSTNKINKGTKVTDKKTKAIYKVESTGSKKTVEYVDNTKKNVTSVSVPDTVKLHGKSYKVTSIGKNAFKDNKKLKKVKIGKNVKTIGKQAFAGCKKLTDITIGKNVTKIEANAFSKCSNLKIITIPENVKKIEKEAFYKCGKLQYFLFKTNKLTPKSVGKNAFGGGYGSPRVKTDKSVWEKYAKIFTSSGMSQDALFIIDPVKLVI